MAAAARVLPSLRSVINALVPTRDGRSVLSDQMDAFIPTIELAYREILLIKHTEGLNVNEESAIHKDGVECITRGCGHCKTCSL